MSNKERMINNGLDPFLKKNTDGSVEKWEGGLNPLYNYKKNNSNLSAEIKINETHLVTLLREESTGFLSVDYLPIINPLEGELNKLYSICEIKDSLDDDLNEILDSNEEFRNVLKGWDFCLNLSRPYQGVISLKNLKFPNKQEIPEDEKIKLINKDKSDLKRYLKDRELPYAIDYTYGLARAKKTY